MHIAAQTITDADASLQFVDDGLTTDQPAGYNNVVGFTPLAGSGSANITQEPGPDGHYAHFDIQLNSADTWSWLPCDASAGPCPPYAGTGYDLQQTLAHSWAHVAGLDDVGDIRDRLLTDSGGIATGPDCGPSEGHVCRFADTLGLGDILGLRHLYPTSAPMPTIYYDQ